MSLKERLHDSKDEFWHPLKQMAAIIEIQIFLIRDGGRRSTMSHEGIPQIKPTISWTADRWNIKVKWSRIFSPD